MPAQPRTALITVKLAFRDVVRTLAHFPFKVSGAIKRTTVASFCPPKRARFLYIQRLVRGRLAVWG